MAEFDKLIAPHDARSHQTTRIFNVVGIITDTHDPKNAHRIKVRVPTLDRGNPTFPSGDEGWVQYCTPFTVNGKPGGAAFPLEVGVEVLLTPVNGNMRQLVAVGCLPNYKDKVYHEFVPGDGKHGFITRGGTADVYDDKNGTNTKAYPTGIVEDRSADGTVTVQTKGKSHVRLGSDGSTAVGNEKGGAMFGSDGEVELSSASGGTVAIDTDGALTLKGKNKSALVLGDRAEIKSGVPKADADVHAIESLISSGLQKISDRLTGAKTVAEIFKMDLENEERILAYGEDKFDLTFKFFEDLGRVVYFMRDLIDDFPNAIERMTALEKYTLKDYVQMLKVQIEEGLRLHLDEVVEAIESAIGDGKRIDADELSESIWEELPPEFVAALTPEQREFATGRIASSGHVIKALDYNKRRVADFILAEIVPNGWTSIECLVGLGIHDRIMQIEEVFNPDVKGIYQGAKQDELEYFDDFESRLQEAISLLPEDLQKYATDEGLMEAFEFNRGTEDNTESEISVAYHGSILQRLMGCKQTAAESKTEEPETPAPATGSGDEMYEFGGARLSGFDSSEAESLLELTNNAGGFSLGGGSESSEASPDTTNTSSNTSEAVPGKTPESEDGIDYEKLESMMLVPGQSPQPYLFAFLFSRLIAEAKERLEQLSEDPEMLNLLTPLTDLLDALKEEEIVAEGNRERLKELLEEVEDKLDAPLTDADIEEDPIADVVSSAGRQVLPDAAVNLESKLKPTVEGAIADFSRLLNSIPSEPTGSSVKVENEGISLSGGAGERGAGMTLGSNSASLFGPKFDSAGDNQSFMTLGKLEAIVGAGGRLGPTMQMTPRTAELLGAARQGGAELADEPDDDEEQGPQLNKKPKSGDKSKTWERPDDEVTYRVGKYGGLKPFYDPLKMNAGGKKAKKKPKKDGKDWWGVAGTGKKPKGYAEESDECVIRPSLTLERTGAVTAKSGLKGAAMAIHQAKAEIFGPETKDPQDNPFRTSFFALEEETGGQAGPHGGTFFAGTQMTQFLAPERGAGDIEDDEDEDDKYNEGGVGFRQKPGLKAEESGTVSEKNEPMSLEGRERLRAGLFADKTGTFGAFSGGPGSAWYGNDQVFEVLGPETEGEDGEKTRFRSFISQHSIAQQAGTKGAVSFLDADMNKILSPEKADGERSFVRAKIDQLLSSAGGDGAISELTDQLANMKSPGGISEMLLDRTKSHVSSPGGQLLLQAGASVLTGNGFNMNMIAGMATFDGFGFPLGMMSPPMTAFTSGVVSLIGGGGMGSVISAVAGGLSVNGEMLEDIIIRVVKEAFGL